MVDLCNIGPVGRRQDPARALFDIQRADRDFRFRRLQAPPRVHAHLQTLNRPLHRGCGRFAVRHFLPAFWSIKLNPTKSDQFHPQGRSSRRINPPRGGIRWVNPLESPSFFTPTSIEASAPSLTSTRFAKSENGERSRRTSRASAVPLMPAINQLSPCRRAKTTSCPGSPTRQRVSSHRAGASRKILRTSGGSDSNISGLSA